MVGQFSTTCCFVAQLSNGERKKERETYRQRKKEVCSLFLFFLHCHSISRLSPCSLSLSQPLTHARTLTHFLSPPLAANRVTALVVLCETHTALLASSSHPFAKRRFKASSHAYVPHPFPLCATLVVPMQPSGLFQRETETERQTDRQRDREERQTDRQTERDPDRQTHTHTHTRARAHTHTHTQQ